MIATTNVEKNTLKEEVNDPKTNVKSEKNETTIENYESHSSDKIQNTSISNTFQNTTETSSNVTENNFRPSKNNQHFYDQSMNGFQQNYGYGYCPPQFYGFENPLVNNFGYQFVNPYYDYSQQMMFYPNYPAYFPADFTNNWNTYGPKNFYQDNQRKHRHNNNQKINQNTDSNGNQQRRYKKPFNRRGENQKPEEEKPKIPDYDLMKSEQVYVDAFPALASTAADKASQPQSTDETDSIDETKGVNKENEIKRVNSMGWSGKKWSEIVNNNQVLSDFKEKNESRQNENQENNLEKQMNGLKIYSDSDSNKLNVQNKVTCWSQPIKC